MTTEKGPTPAYAYALAILGAMLGFTLEPMVGRMVTLAFGGAVHVWTVVVLVFQVVLLASYAWAHLVARRWPLAHLALAVASVLALPLTIVAEPDPYGSIGPLAWTVVVAVGAPFFVTSSAAVVASAWWRGTDPPWRLYALSNAGSLVGLFAYPLVIEPWVGLEAQRTAWTVAYVVFVGLVVRVALQARGAAGGVLARPAVGDLIRWLALSASASWLSLAVTGWIGSEFGSFPLLWTLPLGLYLGSFMLAFSPMVAGWFDNSPLRGAWIEALVMVGLFGCLANEPFLHPGLYVGFFGACWAVHAALFRHRPAVSELTTYYLVVALGGVLGAAVVTLVAPFVFPQLYEFPLGILACAVALGMAGERVDRDWFTTVHWRYGVVRATMTLVMLVLTVGWWLPSGAEVVAGERSLYGVFQVIQRAGDRPYRLLLHGNTTHGAQYGPADPAHDTPMAYFHPSGGNATAVGLRRGERVAVVGLGTGAAAAWVDGPVVFYEIDPVNEALAREWFSFLDDGDEVRLGDARLRLATETDVYDALLVDAFSGDGIPVHLLTVEAFGVWLDHLAPDGVLVLHLSNRFLDLVGVVRADAAVLGLTGAVHQDTIAAGADPLVFAARTVVLARDPSVLDGLDDTWTRFGPSDGVARHTAWTDDYQNLLEPLVAGFTRP